MRRTARNESATIRPACRAALAILLFLSLVPLSRAQTTKKAAARAQYDRAVNMRTDLEGRPQRDRTLEEYNKLVAAYRRVYLITPLAPEVTPALMAIGEIEQFMGRQFDPKYFQSAIDSYRFLLKEYPTSRYRSDALFTIAQIQFQDLNQLDDAQASYQEFLEQYPRSQKIADAQQALQEIASARESASRGSSSRKLAEQRERDQLLPRVTNIREWNAENSTRIVIDLEDTVKYQAARISEPDRIYFDLYNAKLSPSLAGKTFDVQNGFLKAIRVAQNQKGTVRVVLDVAKVKEYSAFLLTSPFRLVIDVYGEGAIVAKNKPDASKLDEAPQTSVPSKSSAPAAPNQTGTQTGTGATTDASSLDHASANRTAPAASAGKSAHSSLPPAPAQPFISAPPPTRDGQHSLTRTLGLKISRIVIDPGHGGHDTGTIGPHGLNEKDLCLDVALRLGKLIEQKIPGAEVVYTRKDDTFVPLEERTAIANQAKADLFISIHANSSPDRSARGIETYYLNFSASEDSMEVASRENALSQSSIHELQDLIKKIASNEKTEESREFASDIQESLTKRMKQTTPGERDRGVKKAPFVVLIGANMPSVLSEVSFISNPGDEKLLKRPDQRQRVAEGLFHGVESYLASLNSLSYNRQKLISDRP